MASERRPLEAHPDDDGALSAPPGGPLNWANVVSLSRIPLAIAFLMTERTPARVALLLAAAATDYIDGWLARRWRQSSRLGEILDPATDKIFVLATLAAFLRDGTLALRDLLVLLARDLVTVTAFGVALVLRLPLRFRARFSGKVVTVLQIATVVVLTTRPAATNAAILITGLASAWAIADYLRSGARSLRAGAQRG